MRIRVTIGDAILHGRLHPQRAPRTCELFVSMLPLRRDLLHARWSGEACWIPLGDARPDMPLENATSEPVPGELLFYPGGISECEILVPYGAARFWCRDGRLAGNPFLTLDDPDRLAAIGREIAVRGARAIGFSLA